MGHPLVAFVAADTNEARNAQVRLAHRYGNTPLDRAEVVVALGGDGFLLETLHRTLTRPVPVYGMNRGSVGFLLNEFSEDGLLDRVARAQQVTLHPLRMCATRVSGECVEGLGDQRGFTAARNPAGRQAPHFSGRRGPAARTDLRRLSGRHPGRQHRL